MHRYNRRVPFGPGVSQGQTDHSLLNPRTGFGPEGKTVELVQAVFEQYRLVVCAHQAALSGMRLSADKHGLDVALYSPADVWSKAQAAIELLLSEYLDLGRAMAGPHASLAQPKAAFQQPPDAQDVSAYFSKKRPPPKARWAVG